MCLRQRAHPLCFARSILRSEVTSRSASDVAIAARECITPQGGVDSAGNCIFSRMTALHCEAFQSQSALVGVRFVAKGMGMGVHMVEAGRAAVKAAVGQSEVG